MRPRWLILGFACYLGLYSAAGVIWGLKGKIHFFIGAIALYAVATGITAILKRRLRDSDAAYPTSDAPDEVAGQPAGHRLAAGWRLLDNLVGLVAIFGGPLLLHAWQHALSWETQVTGYDVAAMFLGCGAYLLVRPRLRRQARSSTTEEDKRKAENEKQRTSR